MKFCKSTILASIVSCAMLIPGLALADSVQLKAQTYYPASMADGIEDFTHDIEKYTRDKIEFNLFYGNSLLSTSNLLYGIKSNVVSVGQIIPHMYTQIPAGKVLSGVPLYTKNAKEAEKLYDDYGYFEFTQKELQKAGLVYLGPTWSAPYHLLSKKPVSKIEDFKGMKIRAIGIMADILRELGVTVVSIAPENLYMALANNDIDGVIFGSAFDYQQSALYEVAPYYNTTPLITPVVDSLVMSEKAWANLSDSDQKDFIQAAKNVRWTWYEEVIEEEQDLINTIFKGKTTSFSTSELNRFNKAAQTVLNEQAKDNPAFKEGLMILEKFIGQ